MIHVEPNINNQMSDDEISAAQMKYRGDSEISRIIECLIVTRNEVDGLLDEIDGVGEDDDEDDEDGTCELCGDPDCDGEECLEFLDDDDDEDGD